ncbi:MAG: aspartate--tRNA(Asn) ligase [Candidatus Levybacteria bacterium]|nr:aspartate--tRNA(Asn) ligase [Candidatus Levybacteria bacterium]
MEQLKRSLSSGAPELIGKEVLLKGWVKTRRDHGKLIFFDLRDRGGIVQLVVNPKIAENTYKTALDIKPEFVIEIMGNVKARPSGTVNKDLPTGEIEIEVKDIKVIAKANPLPFDMGGEELNLELPTLLDNRSLTLRHPKVSAIFKVQETLVGSFRETLKKENFTEIFVPTLVPTATEGGAEVFPVDYYNHKAYLAQSPQMYKQIMTSIYERVFTIAHAYRAEPSVTTRHLSEYISLDAEFGFINSWKELMDMAEKIVLNMLEEVNSKNQNELRLFNTSVFQIKKKIPRIKMQEAQEIIFKRTKTDHRKEMDLDPFDEKEICKWAKEEYGAPFVFITHYPTKKRPFYTMPDSENPDYTLSFDLLGINEEWVTGSQRINDYNRLMENIVKWKNKPENFGIYLQAFSYGMPPEGGFAMGLERLTKDILGLSNIREASLFPRDMERVDERYSQVS